MFCKKFHAVTKRSQMDPNTTKPTETLVQGPMGWIGCIGCEKLQRDFVARTLALITPFHPILHRASCSYETIPNTPKHYETHKNMSLGSNGVDQVCWLRKITKQLRGTIFFINCTSSVCFAPTFMHLWNDPKCTQILRNASKQCYRVQWGGLVAFIAKNTYVTLWHKLLQ